MIEEIRLQQIGVIAEAVIEFGPGLTAITGETGAGKTMLLSGLRMVTGGKVDSGMVRAGSERASAEAMWKVAGKKSADLIRIAEECGAELESHGDRILLTTGRTIAAEGRSRAFAGGRTVPAAMLEELSAELIVIHGQSDQIRLRNPSIQRSLLDRFGSHGIANALTEYQGAFRAWQQAVHELEAEQRSGAESEAHRQRLALAAADIERVNPLPGEDEDLAQRAEILGNATEIMEALRAALHALGGEDGDELSALARISFARRQLDHVGQNVSTAVDFGKRLQAISAEVSDICSDMSALATSVDADPGALDEIQGRRAALTTLKRRYGPTLAEVLDLWHQARSLTSVPVEERIQHLVDTELAARTQLTQDAQALHHARRRAADALAEAVSSELSALAMPQATLHIEVVFDEDLAQWGIHGPDAILFMLSPHHGSPARPVSGAASGGELSRIMLALQVVLAGNDPVETFVFDEVDAGVGGAAAIEIGRRLQQLGSQAQVLVVTHLPQVAAFADRHIVVAKDDRGLVTASSVVHVTGEARLTELARMLSGLPDSSLGSAHAQELLDLAGR